MKYFAEFFHRSPEGWTVPCGSFRIVRLDGRLSRANMERIAADECGKRGYDGFRLGEGQRLEQLFYRNTEIKEVK